MVFMAKNLVTTRRRAFLLGLSTLAGVGTFMVKGKAGHLNNQFWAISEEERDFRVFDNIPLRDRAAVKGLVYGAAGPHGALSSDVEFAAYFAQECAILVPESVLKWEALRPDPNRFDFTAGDRLAAFARNHGLLYRGHTLVWHRALPQWFEPTVNSRNAEQLLLDHIATVVGHYAGKMHSWDVVNEAVHPQDGRPDGLRNSPWLQLLGPDYIDIAFRAAAEADPQALLVYNDYGLDYDTREEEARRTAVLKLLERLKSKGTPIQALGIQAHLLRNDKPFFNPAKLSRFLREVASLDLKILITEMDVTDKKLPSDVTRRDRLVAAAYEDYLSVVLQEPAVIAVLTWGLSDRYTWLAQDKPRADRAPVRPLPLDVQLRRKLAWNAIARAFDKAPKR